MHCQHDMCLCRVDAVEEVCGEHCREMTALAGNHDACRCGHDACAVAAG